MIGKILALFTLPERRRFYMLIVLLVVSSLLEVVGIASILPFMEVVSRPGPPAPDTIPGRLYSLLGVNRVEHFRFILGGLVLLLVTASNGFLVLTKTLVTRFTWRRNYSIARELIARYLHAPYIFFLDRNSADLSKNILTEVGIFINGVLVPLMDVIAKGLATVFILALLVIVDPLVAIAVALTLSAFYLAVLGLVHKRLRVMGEQRIRANTMLFTSVNQAFGGIKEIKLLGKEDVFVRNFSEPATQYAALNTRMTIMSIIPRHVLEIIAYAAVVAVLLYLLEGGKRPEEALPVLSLYALAGFRLMPYFEIIYSGLARVRFNRPSLDQLYRDFSERGKANPALAISDRGLRVTYLDRLELRDIHYRYPNAPRAVLSGLTMMIRRGATIGLAGASGSGKTTTVDLILGLFAAQRGGLFVDGVEVSPANVRLWQRRLGYVPQQIYLIDGSIAENIALGLDAAEVVDDRVVEVSRTARLHEFVTSLPDGYDTIVGERGVRLSGGQRQRIGIARALYRGPELLILDEATNALDGVTEREVIDAIRALDTPHTLVIISHRLTALQDCDEIHLFDSGAITTTGTYHMLIRQSDVFRAMARAGD